MPVLRPPLRGANPTVRGPLISNSPKPVFHSPLILKHETFGEKALIVQRCAYYFSEYYFGGIICTLLDITGLTFGHLEVIFE